MRKIILMNLLFACATGAFSQFHFGVEAGSGYSGFVSSNADAKYKIPAIAGVYFNNVSSDYYFEIAVQYEYKGIDMSGFIDNYGNIRSLSSQINSLKIPVMIATKTWQGSGRNRYHAFKVGAYLSKAFVAKGSIAGIDNSNNPFSATVNNIYKDNSYSLNGESYEFPTFKSVDFGVRLAYDIVFDKFRVSAIFDSSGVFSNRISKIDKRIYSGALYLTLGYQIF